jgi:Tol biopolymer transport system component
VHSKFAGLVGLCVTAAAAAAVSVPAPGASARGFEQVSVSSRGKQGNGFSAFADVSAAGRFVAFDSEATNLVRGDTNRVDDEFVRDRRRHRTIRVSISSTGGQGNHDSGASSISEDGRIVAFTSEASNLVNGDTNGTEDVFVRDLRKHRTTRVSVSSAGAQANAGSLSPSVSRGGRLIAFESTASNLVSGDTNGALDVFVHDRKTRRTTRVSVDSAGRQADQPPFEAISYDPAISADGRVVAFTSGASDLVPGDTNSARDIFVHDLKTHRTARVSLDSHGKQANDSSFVVPALSRQGRFVAFGSNASNLVAGDRSRSGEIFVRDRRTHRTSLVSVSSRGTPSGGCFGDWDSAIGMSPHGRFVSFDCRNDLLLDRKRSGFNVDVFVRDRKIHRTARVTVSRKVGAFFFDSFGPAISADGRFVAFSSGGPLVPADTNDHLDVYVARRPHG